MKPLLSAIWGSPGNCDIVINYSLGIRLNHSCQVAYKLPAERQSHLPPSWHTSVCFIIEYKHDTGVFLRSGDWKCLPKQAGLQVGAWHWQHLRGLESMAELMLARSREGVEQAISGSRALASAAITWQMDKWFFFRASSKMKLMETIKWMPCQTNKSN